MSHFRVNNALIYVAMLLQFEQSLFHVGLDDAVYPCPQHVGRDSGSELNDEDQTQEDGEGHGHAVRFLHDTQHRLAH